MKLSKRTSSLFISVFVLSTSLVFSQQRNSIAMPEMPSMPSISSPTIGSGFYSPSSNGFYMGIKPAAKEKTQAKKEETANVSTPALTNRYLTEETKKNLNEEILKSLAASNNSSVSAQKSNILTANDMYSLDNLGLFNSLSGLLDNRKALAENQSNQQDNSETLEKILEKLSEIKSNTDSSQKAVSFSNVEKANPKILRFNVDKVDYLRTVKTAYFSREEPNGTFLLTGDLKYSAGGKARNETFYMFFNSAGTENSSIKYNVSVSKSQENDNYSSFLKKLSEKQNLSAIRTGNLVSLRANDEDLNVDLLLALDN